MREKIKAGGHSSPYRLRKQLPEPVFGQIKQARGFRQFLLRGVEKVANEWGLVCLAHNILKLAQGRTRPWPRSDRLSFATSETVQRTMPAKLPPNLTSNRMREFAASGSPTGLSGSNPISPRIKQQAPRAVQSVARPFAALGALCCCGLEYSPAAGRRANCRCSRALEC